MGTGHSIITHLGSNFIDIDPSCFGCFEHVLNIFLPQVFIHTISTRKCSHAQFDTILVHFINTHFLFYLLTGWHMHLSPSLSIFLHFTFLLLIINSMGKGREVHTIITRIDFHDHGNLISFMRLALHLKTG